MVLVYLSIVKRIFNEFWRNLVIRRKSFIVQALWDQFQIINLVLGKLYRKNCIYWVRTAAQTNLVLLEVYVRGYFSNSAGMKTVALNSWNSIELLQKLFTQKPIVLGHTFNNGYEIWKSRVKTSRVTIVNSRLWRRWSILSWNSLKSGNSLLSHFSLGALW